MPENLLNQSAEPPATTDVLIVGGGPAGLAASIALRQRGIRCVVVEARPQVIDKACGEGLMPDSRAVLARLGVTLTHADGQTFRGIRFANATHSIEAAFSDGEGIGIRRTHLHSLLASRAETLGARLLWESRVKFPYEDGHSEPHRAKRCEHAASVNGRTIRYRWLIGADGQASTVRRWAGLDRAHRQSQRYGFRTHCRVDTRGFDKVEVHWGCSGQLYLTPVALDCMCVVYLSRYPHCGKMGMFAEFPAVVRRLVGAHGLETVSQQRGAVSATLKLCRVTANHIALIGDASGSTDSITGEGLAVSFRQALALADAIACDSLAAYERAHREIARLPHAMGALMLTLDRWPRFQAHAMRALAASPAFFTELLEAHVGIRSLASVLARHGLRFSWKMLASGVQHGESNQKLVSDMSIM